MRYTVLIWVCTLAVILAGAVATTAQDESPIIRGGIVNGKATKLPAPEYPEELRIAGIGGRVFIRVVIEEAGNVSSAEHYIDPDATKPSNAEPPHPLLIEAAREAALKAEFPPSVSNDVSARIPVVLVYNFSKELRVKDSGVAKQDPSEPMRKGGVLNGRARSLPAPEYPASAKAVRAAGAVTVEVVIDETGSVEFARAISGHPLLRASAVAAAQKAKFSPTYHEGMPVKVSGVIVYNFALPD